MQFNSSEVTNLFSPHLKIYTRISTHRSTIEGWKKIAQKSSLQPIKPLENRSIPKTSWALKKFPLAKNGRKDQDKLGKEKWMSRAFACRNADPQAYRGRTKINWEKVMDVKGICLSKCRPPGLPVCKEGKTEQAETILLLLVPCNLIPVKTQKLFSPHLNIYTRISTHRRIEVWRKEEKSAEKFSAAHKTTRNRSIQKPVGLVKNLLLLKMEYPVLGSAG
ncbi:hypothetical protein CEXT_379461 [Caerostris extrusa]|uniref:Uncharacterized protein n=1 Tax=Caerostris extrusa TaxID=172846 RepID=A0AAV4XFS1_CAEEX|nr:hypothetical protein CEXT_379461 [Caerostris extrusa]